MWCTVKHVLVSVMCRAREYRNIKKIEVQILQYLGRGETTHPLLRQVFLK